MRKKTKIDIFNILILIILSLALFSQTSQLLGSEEIAERHFKSTILSQIGSQIKQESPLLPDDALNKISQEAYEELINDPDYQKKLNQEVLKLKEYYTNEDGVPYLSNYDTYFYLRQAHNFANKGIIGEYEKNGISYDNLIYAPHQQYAYFNLFPYSISISYKILDKLIITSIESVAFWSPVFFGILSVLLFYFITKLLFGTNVSILASSAFTIHPGTLNIFKAGSPDTQIINVFLSLLIVFLTLKTDKEIQNIALKNWKTYIIPVTYSLLIILSVFLFYLTWTGYFYIIILLVSYLILRSVQILIKNKKYNLIWGLVPISLIFVYILINSSKFILILKRLHLFEEKRSFPTAWSTITELQGFSILEYSNFLTIIFLLFSFIGVFFLIKNWKELDEKIIILIWACIALLPLLSRRFYPYSLAPLAILFGLGVWKLSEKIPNSKYFNKKIYAGIFMIFLIINVIPSNLTIINDLPYMDDSIYHISQEIKKSNGSIITTWWDEGYIYEYYTRKPVLFDGGSFTPERLYWVSRALLSENENESKGIIRMLSCGGEQVAQSRLPTSIETINKIILMNKEQTLEFYKKNNISFPISYTHCNTSGILVLNSNMLRKINNFNYFSKWSFEYGVSFANENLIQKGNCFENYCTGGLNFNLNTNESTINGEPIQKLIYLNEIYGNETIIENANGIPLTALIVNEEVYYLKQGLENSLVIKGLFLGLENYDLISLVQSRKLISAYNINFE